VLERPVRSIEHAGPVQRLVRVRGPFDVQLVPGCAVESVLLVRADLRLDVARAEECECATRDCGARQIEMQCDLPTTPQVHAAGDVEQSGELGEAITVRIGRDLRKLVAQLLRE
jgi:hypothetical protein